MRNWRTRLYWNWKLFIDGFTWFEITVLSAIAFGWLKFLPHLIESLWK